MAVDQRQYSRWDVVVPGIVEHAWATRHDAPSVEILLPDGRGLAQLVVGEPAQLVDVTTGVRRAEESGVRGLLTRPLVRIAQGPAVRVGLQLHPMALGALGAGALVDAWVPAELVADAELVTASASALDAGDGEGAARRLAGALAARRQPDQPEAERFREVLRHVDATHGAVSAPELARFAQTTVSDLYRWSVRYLGVEPTLYVGAVRFSVFVRRAVGPGVVRPDAVLRALRWYAEGGYSSREVERTTGMSAVDLRLVEERIASLVTRASV
ncbi:hypothetical protein [Cellulomonas edaphi]|uniref:HTH araC/xylS-type domain-containing protein n=1 Tax=Cellulomonas edaphi TaxID=3053468 RepID=A0ABT7SAT3_9CELL|nr:hypothetical protein [Cellulomons edaphi]MDM7832736.1 hypothetical protein [Cellulomons edaphi]